MHMRSEARIVVFQSKPALRDLDLSATRPVGGSVRFDGGRPLAGITVRLWDHAWKLVGAVQTDSAGAYRFEGVSPGSYHVSVDVPAGFDAARSEAPVAVGASGDLGVEFRLSESGLLHGRVVDEHQGVPVAGAEVEVYNAMGVRVAAGRTSASGDYAFSGLPKGEHTVRLPGAGS